MWKSGKGSCIITRFVIFGKENTLLTNVSISGGECSPEKDSRCFQLAGPQGGATVCEGGVAEVTSERPDVDMSPVVDDQASALREHGVAVAVLANEVCHAPPLIVLVDHFDLFI